MEKLYQKLAEILEVDVVNSPDVIRDFDNWDSLSLLISLSMIDDEFGVNITSVEFEKIFTVGELEQLIIEKQGK